MLANAVVQLKDLKYFKAAQERISSAKKIEDNYLDTLENNKSKPRIIPNKDLMNLDYKKREIDERRNKHQEQLLNVIFAAQ
mgnify:CR=1 FL=1